MDVRSCVFVVQVVELVVGLQQTYDDTYAGAVTFSQLGRSSDFLQFYNLYDKCTTYRSNGVWAIGSRLVR